MTKFFHKHHASVIEVLYWVFLVYVFSMYVFPWFSGGGWIYVQKVWDRWQTLNAGVFAFAAAVVGFSIAKYRFEQDRINELSSVRALLPNALNQICSYCDDLKDLTDNAFDVLNFDVGDFDFQPPVFSAEIYDIFSRAIKLASGDVKEQLAKILEVQQVVDARINSLVLSARRESRVRYVRSQRYEFYRKIAELRFRTDSLFPFARREMEDIDSAIGMEDAYRILGFNLIPEFLDFVQRGTR